VDERRLRRRGESGRTPLKAPRGPRKPKSILVGNFEQKNVMQVFSPSAVRAHLARSGCAEALFEAWPKLDAACAAVLDRLVAEVLLRAAEAAPASRTRTCTWAC
jgi:hypothetical protein